MVLSTNQTFRASFVVSSFRHFAIETEEQNKFQFIEFETRPAMIAPIAMATRLTQPECAFEAQHVSQLFGCWIQGWGSKDTEKASCVKSSTNKTARFVSVVQKICRPPAPRHAARQCTSRRQKGRARAGGQSRARHEVDTTRTPQGCRGARRTAGQRRRSHLGRWIATRTTEMDRALFGARHSPDGHGLSICLRRGSKPQI